MKNPLATMTLINKDCNSPMQAIMFTCPEALARRQVRINALMPHVVVQITYHTFNSLKEIELSYEEFAKVNEVELNCIFAKNGSIYELDFDPEAETEALWSNHDKYCMKYGNLKWYKEVHRLQ